MTPSVLAMLLAAVAAGGSGREAPRAPWLLIGVYSLPARHNGSKAAASLVRRNNLRSLVGRDPRVDLRFVMAREAAATVAGSDAARSDMLFFDVPSRNAQNTRKFLLQSAFFRHAIGTGYELIARADDDALFNVSAVATHLAHWRHEPYLCYGPFRNWYMWDPAAFMPTCWQFKVSRFLTAYSMWKRTHNLTRFTYGGVVPAQPACSNRACKPNECWMPGTYGPFPFMAGPFTAYSKHLVRELLALPQLAADDAYVRGPRETEKIRSAYNGRVYRPGSKMHPASQILFEDVYFGYLMFRYLANRSLTLVYSPISEMRRKAPPLFNAHVYHRLKSPGDFDYARNHSAELMRVQRKTLYRCDRRWGDKTYRLTRHCRNWTFCAFHYDE